MSARNNTLILSGLLLWLASQQAFSAMPTEGLQLKTLFTTPEERALIDRNRYRQEPRVRPPSHTQAPKEQPAAPEPMISVEKEYQISGISINADGTDVAWINGEEYENGARIDNAIRLRISAHDGRLKLIAPDGKTYRASAGDVVVIRYRQPADQ